MYFTAYPQASPRIAPKNTSVGKCTCRYNLEKPIINAQTKTVIFMYLGQFEKITTNAKAKAVLECPDGNE